MAVTFSGTFIVALRQLSLAQRGHVTDRLTRAIDQLGSKATVTRLGAIYALDRISGESASERVEISEILSAFVRERASWVSRSAGGVPVDIQAALSVVANVPDGKRS